MPRRNYMRLLYPTINPTHLVLLPTPDFGNTFAYQQQRISRTARGLTRKVFRDSAWPDFEVINMQFSSLHPDQLEIFVTFLKVSLGKLIEIQDYEDSVWHGHINNPNGIFALTGRECSQTLEFEFQGQLISSK